MNTPANRSGASPSNTLVSVVIPAFNAQDTLARTLESAIAQTHQALDIVVVDDGSKDGTLAIAKQFASRDPRIRVISGPNGGVARARNLGLEAARSEFVAPLDADDLWHPTKTERQLAALESAEDELAFVYSRFRVIDADDHVLATAPVMDLCGSALARHVYQNAVGNGSGFIARRSALLAAGGYDHTLQDRGAHGCEDFLIQLRMAGRHNIGFVPGYLVGYRRLPGNMSSNLQRMVVSYRLALEDIAARHPELPSEPFRWSEALFLSEQALGSASRRDWSPACDMMLRALRLDLTGTLSHISGRVGERLRSQAKTSTPSPSGASTDRAAAVPPTRHFNDFSPEEGPVELAPWIQRRMTTLAKLDRKLAPARL